jgi:hypothetical protein
MPPKKSNKVEDIEMSDKTTKKSKSKKTTEINSSGTEKLSYFL